MGWRRNRGLRHRTLVGRHHRRSIRWLHRGHRRGFPRSRNRHHGRSPRSALRAAQLGGPDPPRDVLAQLVRRARYGQSQRARLVGVGLALRRLRTRRGQHVRDPRRRQSRRRGRFLRVSFTLRTKHGGRRGHWEHGVVLRAREHLDSFEEVPAGRQPGQQPRADHLARQSHSRNPRCHCDPGWQRRTSDLDRQPAEVRRRRHGSGNRDERLYGWSRRRLGRQPLHGPDAHRLFSGARTRSFARARRQHGGWHEPRQHGADAAAHPGVRHPAGLRGRGRQQRRANPGGDRRSRGQRGAESDRAPRAGVFSSSSSRW